MSVLLGRSQSRTETGPPRLTAVVIAAVAFYSLFIARAAFVVDGRLTFTLFDDAMISMTYARNLARGDGMVWNAGGERVEGITNPLWTVVMAVPHWLHVPDQWTALVISLIAGACLVGCIVLARNITWRITRGDRVAALAAAGLTGFCYPLIYWSLRGMEVGLITLLVLGGTLLTLLLAAAWSARDAWGLAALSVLAVSTRLDAVVFFGICWLYLAWQMRGAERVRALVIVGGSTFAALVGQELWRHAYYGEWTPNTYTLKVAHVAVTERLERGALGLVAIGIVSLTLLIVCAGIVLAKRREPPLVLLAGLATVAAAYSVFVGGDAWEWMYYANRYLVPGVVVLVCLAAAAIPDLQEMIRRGDRPVYMLAGVSILCMLGILIGLLPTGHNLTEEKQVLTPLLALTLIPIVHLCLRGRALPVGSLALALVIALGIQISGPGLTVWASQGPIDADADERNARYGDLLGAVTTDDAVVAVVVSGLPIYFSHRTGLDLLGKSDRRIAELPVRDDVGFWPGHSKWDYEISILGDRPDVIAHLWLPTEDEVAAIYDAGYVNVRPNAAVSDQFGLAPDFYVREDSQAVRWDRLVPSDPTKS